MIIKLLEVKHKNEGINPYLAMFFSFIIFSLVFVIAPSMSRTHAKPTNLVGTPPASVSTVQAPQEFATREVAKVSPSTCTDYDLVIDEMTSVDYEREWLKRVMRCESGCRSGVSNYTGSGAYGLMQFMPRTFYGNGGVDIGDGSEQLQVALKMYRNGQSYQWECK